MPFEFELLAEILGTLFRAFSGYIMSTGFADE
jgi:hypothetical protein